MREAIELCNADINKNTFKSTVIMSIAEGGAMGEPGAICFYTDEGIFYHLNYVFGDAKLDKVEKHFPVLKDCDFGMFGLDSSVPEGWNYYNLGMGNHLIVNSCVNDKFSELLGDEEEPSIIYGRWREIAETMLCK